MHESLTGNKAFPISKLGGWKHNIAFHKSSETNSHQTLKHHIDNTDVMEIDRWQQGRTVDLLELG